MQNANSEIIIDQNADGKIKIDVRLEDETAWLRHIYANYLIKTNVRFLNIFVIFFQKVNCRKV